MEVEKHVQAPFMQAREEEEEEREAENGRLYKRYEDGHQHCIVNALQKTGDASCDILEQPCKET